ncbi:hypothetical protein FB446DRAFT_776513 [Lentinula raphanica]|nr:hypothetical protein FB446DRAFT_776513 [Lentinula raphanica]
MYLLSRRSLTSGPGFLQNCVLFSILLAAIPIDDNDSKPKANDSEPKVQEAQNYYEAYVHLTRYDETGRPITTLLLDWDNEQWSLGIGSREKRTEFIDNPSSPGELIRREVTSRKSTGNRGLVGIIRFKFKVGNEESEKSKSSKLRSHNTEVVSAKERLFMGIMALPPKSNRFESNIQIKRYLEGSLKLENFPLPDLEFKPYPDDPWERIYRAMEGPAQNDVDVKEVNDWTKPAENSDALKIATSDPPSTNEPISALEASRILYHMANEDSSVAASGSNLAVTDPQQRNLIQLRDHTSTPYSDLTGGSFISSELDIQSIFVVVSYGVQGINFGMIYPSSNPTGLVGITRFNGPATDRDALNKGIEALPPANNQFEAIIHLKRYLEGSLKLEKFPHTEQEKKEDAEEAKEKEKEEEKEGEPKKKKKKKGIESELGFI